MTTFETIAELPNGLSVMFEDTLAHDPQNIKLWLDYIDRNEVRTASTAGKGNTETDAEEEYVVVPSVTVDMSDSVVEGLQRRSVLYERALHYQPESYKLWLAYIKDFLRQLWMHTVFPPANTYEPQLSNYTVYSFRIDYKESRVEAAPSATIDSNLAIALKHLFGLFPRALVFLPDCPVLWELYLLAACRFSLVRVFRVAVDMALQSLPITQHERIWNVVLLFLFHSKRAQQLKEKSEDGKDTAGSAVALNSLATLAQDTYKSYSDKWYFLLAGKKGNWQLTSFAKRTGIDLEAHLSRTDYASRMPLGSVRLLRRYLQIQPEALELYCRYLVTIHKEMENAKVTPYAEQLKSVVLLEAADVMRRMIDERAVASSGYSQFDLWMDFCNLLTTTAAESTFTLTWLLNILRHAASKFADATSALWLRMAEIAMKKGLPDVARNVFEEALLSVGTLKDFTAVYEGYSTFLEKLVEAQIIMMQKAPPKEKQSIQRFVNLHMARLRSLIERRPLLVSSVRLRLNPHNCKEWLHRIDLYKQLEFEKKKGDDDVARQNATSAVLDAFNEAIHTIDPQLASHAKFSTIWIFFARYYETNSDLESGLVILDKAAHVRFKNVDDLASVWCERVELLLRHGQYTRALDSGRIATQQSHCNRMKHKTKFTESVRLWSLLLDLEESLGTYDTLKAAYSNVFEARVVTPMMVLSYTAYLQKINHFEASFGVFERSLRTFRWPHIYPILLCYLTSFWNRYGPRKIERLREIVECELGFDDMPTGPRPMESLAVKVLTAEAPKESKYHKISKTIPPNLLLRIVWLYYKIEKEGGRIQRGLSALMHAVTLSRDDNSTKFKLYQLIVAEASSTLGIAKSRPVFEAALEDLRGDELMQMCIRFATIERSLGEIDRSRSIYVFTSQFAPPNQRTDFWELWKKFEIMHGNEETYRNMLRIKRSVEFTYSDAQFTVQTLIKEAQEQRAGRNPMDALAASVAGAAGDPPGGTAPPAAAAASEVLLAEAEKEYQHMQASRRTVEADPSVMPSQEPTATSEPKGDAPEEVYIG